ncbi:MAG TPA: diguanylate cyclase, partial [Minicystis sp.]|nr:diguanylate cyclase [Minicystis sp.]
MAQSRRAHRSRPTAPRQSAVVPVVNPAPASDIDADPLRVLVVDDDPDARAALVRAVAALGHACDAARDGEEAWRRHASERYDVIVSDWMMPRTTGPELCDRVRSAGGPYVYFVLASGVTDRRKRISGMGFGADDYLTKPIDLAELEARFRAAARVVRAERRLRRENAELRRDSEISFLKSRLDALTGVGNRWKLEDDLTTLGARADRYGHVVSAAICDVDRFKAHNDHFGHLAGDAVLRGVAGAITAELRRADSIYRYGGEEFLILLPGQRLASAVVAMERVRRAVEQLAIPTHPAGVVTVSIGVAERGEATGAPALARTNEEWLRRADAAMYAAKGLGRNRVCSEMVI